MWHKWKVVLALLCNSLKSMQEINKQNAIGPTRLLNDTSTKVLFNLFIKENVVIHCNLDVTL